MTYFGLFLLLVAAAIFFLPSILIKPAKLGAGTACLLLGLIAIGYGTSIHVEGDEIGIVYKISGADQPQGKIIATNGEKGYQAQTYGYGRHYFVNIPLYQTVTPQKIIVVPTGHVAVLTAKDGKSLPPDETFAPEWTDPEKMLNATYFLTQGGYKGPQLTALPPGNYPINTALFEVAVIPAINVAAGQVAVIKDKGGKLAEKEITNVNGNPIVPNGYRGIWVKPLNTGVYYLNPVAREPIFVATTEMSYTYQNGRDEKNQPYHEAISIRTKDGFQAYVDVRVNGVLTPLETPLLVATVGDPDKVEFSNQEQSKLSRMEAVIILPTVRSVVRNIAETIEALNLVNNRTAFEKAVSDAIKAILESKNIKVNSVLIGNIDLTATEAGKTLLETQTDKRVAQEQEATFEAKKKAEEKRQSLVRATTEANQEENLAKAQKAIAINTQQGLADVKRAEGEGAALVALATRQNEAYRLRAEILGAENVAKLEIIKAAGEKNVVITPQVVTGNATSLMLNTGK